MSAAAMPDAEEFPPRNLHAAISTPEVEALRVVIRRAAAAGRAGDSERVAQALEEIRAMAASAPADPFRVAWAMVLELDRGDEAVEEIHYLLTVLSRLDADEEATQ